MGQLCEAARDRPMERCVQQFLVKQWDSYVQLLETNRWERFVQLLQAGKWVRPDSGNAA